MKVSGFTFLRNGQKLGYPFVASIRSILPLLDEFIIALGPCDDDTEKMVRDIGDPKIRIIATQWNERIQPDYSVKGFVYGQQKSIALFNCTGDWAFYLEADEVLHENDLPKIRASMEKYLDDKRVEALAFDYLHFYGNKNTIAWSPGWYRSEVRIIRNTIPAWSSEALFFNVVDGHKKSRYPRAAHTGTTIFHYGWVRSEAQMNLKSEATHKYWDAIPAAKADYAKIDAGMLKLFSGTHPQVVQAWLPAAENIFQADPNHRPSSREKKHRRMLWLEKTFGLSFNKKHYQLVR
ncbi:MAG TPA: glycosyltransferase [Verrucomicrobiae bacterium]|jgi:glycosyltransferase involved in cell wall biosynthesis